MDVAGFSISGTRVVALLSCTCEVLKAARSATPHPTSVTIKAGVENIGNVAPTVRGEATFLVLWANVRTIHHEW